MDKVAAKWGDAAFTRDLANTSWMASVPVLMHLNERATGDPARDWLSGWATPYFASADCRVLVLGAGEGWLERAIAAWPFVSRIDAVDIAPDAIARAREAAPPKTHYSVFDLNRDELEPDAYDVIVAHMVLHHVQDLEHAFEQIGRALKDDGFLIVNEYTGPKRFQYSDDVLAMINELAAAMQIPPRERPTEAFMIEVDPSEAVRSDELLPMLYEHFDVVDVRRQGGMLLQHLLYGVAQDYRFEVPRERSIIDMLCTFEGALTDMGAIPSAFNILAARKHGSGAPPLERPLAPRPEAANDVEPDPLRMRKRVKSQGRAAGILDQWHLRLLRIALASTQARRANLFEEQAMHAAMERFRFAVARTSAFDWIASRYRAYGSDPVILALLETFDRLAPE